jgi:hypothetical protein
MFVNVLHTDCTAPPPDLPTRRSSIVSSVLIIHVLTRLHNAPILQLTNTTSKKTKKPYAGTIHLLLARVLAVPTLVDFMHAG